MKKRKKKKKRKKEKEETPHFPEGAGQEKELFLLLKELKRKRERKKRFHGIYIFLTKVIFKLIYKYA